MEKYKGSKIVSKPLFLFLWTTYPYKWLNALRVAKKWLKSNLLVQY